MSSPSFSNFARGVALAACWMLVGCVALAALDIATATPGVWHLVPRFAERPLLLGPLVAAILGLALTGLALVRHEPGARHSRTWLMSVLIAMFYLAVVLLSHFHPMVVY